MGFSATDALAAVGVFIVVGAVWAIAALLWQQRKAAKTRSVRARVGAEPKAAESRERVVKLFHEGNEVEAVLPGAGSVRGIAAKGVELRRTLDAAGIRAPVGSVLLAIAGAAAGVALLTFATTGHPLGSLVGGGVVVFAAQTVIKMRAAKQEAKFDDQFVEALGLIARSLRAGHTVTSGMSLAAEDSPEPVKSLFSRIVQEQEFGVTLEQALRNAAADHPSQDLNLFAASVAIQVRAGGNLADTVQRLASVIRERLALSRRVRVLTAQTQMSKQVLIALPVILFGLLNVINPEYVDPMYSTPTGQLMLSIAVGGLLVGSWVMGKMAVLKY